MALGVLIAREEGGAIVESLPASIVALPGLALFAYAVVDYAERHGGGGGR